MKLRELLPCLTSELWVTFEEDPNRAEPEIRVNITSGADWGEAEVLSDALLNSDVHLMCSHEDVCFVSIREEATE